MTAVAAAPTVDEARTAAISAGHGSQTWRHAEWGLLARDRPGTTWAHDSEEAIAYPIVPLSKNVESLVQTDDEGEREVRYPGIGWRIVLPPPSKGVLPAGTILDIYMGLLFLFAAAGFPADGRVYFSRYHLLTLLGLSSAGRDGHGRRTWKPSGKHYRRLKAALRYLMRTLLVNDDVSRPQTDIDGQSFCGAQGFPILQYYRLEANTTASSDGQAFVIFSEPFVKLMARGERTTRVDWGVYLSLSSGTPRHLFRMLSYMRQHGRSRVTIQEAFERIGSMQRTYLPARARQILGKAHRELMQRGVLSAEPEYLQTPEGTHVIEYRFGDPRALLSEEEVVVRQALDYGVSESVARSLAVTSRVQLERVLAATTLGILRPKKSLAHMIVHYTKRNLPILDHDTGAQLSEAQHEEGRYVDWTADERQLRLQYMARENGLDAEATLSRIETHVRERCGDQPAWVVKGLVQVRLNQLLNIPGLGEAELPTR